MSRISKACIVFFGIAIAGVSLGQEPDITPTDLERGIEAAQEGRHADAIAILDSVVLRLENEPKPAPKLLSRAFLFLAIAHFGLGNDESAKSAFGQALQRDPNLEITTAEFPPRIVRFFEGARAEIEAARKAKPALAGTPKPSKGGGSKTWLLVGVGAAAVGGGVAVLAGKKSGASPDCASAGVTATTTSTASGRVINCTEVERLTIQLTNNQCETVSINRITRTGNASSGRVGCGSSQDTYVPTTTSVAAGQTAAILSDQPSTNLPGGVSGCCNGACPGSSAQCAVSFEVEVETSAGTINAGSYQAMITFNNCQACPSFSLGPSIVGARR